ncbi:MAG TPA: hypothetical protein VFN18_04130 [Solirubrobacterales bacterium]|nr:hypothetical protein [Solirubrobacterales bacterium]
MTISTFAEPDSQTEQTKLHVWITCNHRPVTIRDVRLYFGRPRRWKPKTRRAEQDPPPNFLPDSADAARAIADRPVTYVLALSDYEAFQLDPKKPKRWPRLATHVGVRTKDGHRYAKRIPRRVRRANRSEA